MFDYREWCRLCGSIDGVGVEIQADVLNLIEILEVNSPICLRLYCQIIAKLLFIDNFKIIYSSDLIRKLKNMLQLQSAT